MEKLLVVCTVLGGIAAVIYFWEKISQWFISSFRLTKSKSEDNKQNANDGFPKNVSTFDQESEIFSESNPPKNSTVFFYDRFASAFPGVRGIEWYNSKDGINRLKLIFKKPFVFKENQCEITPIWYWRGGNMHIDHFEVLNRKTILLRIYELQISRIAAVNIGSYYQCFLYLEVEPMKQTGLYKYGEEEIAESVKNYGYVSEEYGLYKGKYKITRAEYDDNAAKIKGKIVTLGNDAELRARFITPYNLIIAPFSSPINNNKFDFILKDYMNRILNSDATLNELSKEVLKLPKKEIETRG